MINYAFLYHHKKVMNSYVFIIAFLSIHFLGNKKYFQNEKSELKVKVFLRFET